MKFCGLCVPTVSANLLLRVMNVINLMFIAKLENAAMTAGVGLATSLVTTLAYSFLVGANCAQETLTSQAYGAGELGRCGDLLNRGRVVSITLFIPIAIVFLFSEQIFLMIGQDPEVSFYAG